MDSVTSAIRSTVEGGESEVFTALALSPNDKLLFSAGHSRQIRVWDLSTMTCVRSWKVIHYGFKLIFCFYLIIEEMGEFNFSTG